MKRFALLLLSLCLGACAGSHDALIVKQFQLRDETRDNSQEPMARMEKEHRLYGAVSMEERKQRLGQYYTALWSDPKGYGTGPVEVVFEYRQGGTGSLIKTDKREFPEASGNGVAEFSVIGDNYIKNGKVLAWRIKVLRGGRQIDSKQSYLWD